MPPSHEPVDVVIPVYNAPDLACRCIDSLYRWLGDDLAQVHVQDDASRPETARMLDALRWPRLAVHHEPVNLGFAQGVNRGVARTQTRLVLVVNSDVEARSNFLEPLVESLAADPRLAAVSPAGNSLRGYDLAHYPRSFGYVPTMSLWGYAFVLRRSAWDELGGFDSGFARGFFEDLDLSRRLLARGWRLGVHPGADLYHVGHGSFDDVPERSDIYRANRARYLERWPAAARHVLLVGGDEPLDAHPELRADLEAVLRAGGAVTWLHRGPPKCQIALPMRARALRVDSALFALERAQRKGRHQVTDLWFSENAPTVATAALGCWARLRGVPVRHPTDVARH